MISENKRTTALGRGFKPHLEHSIACPCNSVVRVGVLWRDIAFFFFGWNWNVNELNLYSSITCSTTGTIYNPSFDGPFFLLKVQLSASRMKRIVCLFESLRVRCYRKQSIYCIGSTSNLKIIKLVKISSN